MGKEEKVFSSFPTMFSTVDIVRLELTFLTSFRFTKLRRLIDRTTWKRKSESLEKHFANVIKNN